MAAARAKVGANAIARAGGYSDGYGSRLLDGYAKMPHWDRCSQIADRLGVNVLWLMTGRGPMVPAGDEDLSAQLVAKLEELIDRRLGSEPPPAMMVARLPQKRTSSGSMPRPSNDDEPPSERRPK